MIIKIPAISNYFLKEQGVGTENVLFKMSDTGTLAWVVKALCACQSWKLTISSINRFYRLSYKNVHPAWLRCMKIRAVLAVLTHGRLEGIWGRGWALWSTSVVPGGFGNGSQGEGSPVFSSSTLPLALPLTVCRNSGHAPSVSLIYFLIYNEINARVSCSSNGCSGEANGARGKLGNWKRKYT